MALHSIGESADCDMSFYATKFGKRQGAKPDESQEKAVCNNLFKVTDFILA